MNLRLNSTILAAMACVISAGTFAYGAPNTVLTLCSREGLERARAPV